MVTLARRAARTPLAPVVAVMFGLVAAILVAAVPGWMFNQAVQDSGLPAIVHYATPPLGLTARIIACGSAFILTALVLWIVLSQVEKLVKKNKRTRIDWQDQGYVAVTADEPVKVEGRRRPIFAPAELGAPLMSDEAIASVSVAEPFPEMESDPELEAPLSIVEFDLPPEETSEDADAIVGEDTGNAKPEQEDNSIQALIRRLETGLARRAANDPGPDSPTSAPSYDPEAREPRSPLSLSREWIAPATQPTDDETPDDIRQALGALSRFASR